MHENELARIVVSTAYEIHTKLGPGLFESVYETIKVHELINNYQLAVVQQLSIPVVWNEMKLDHGFRADLLVGGKLIVELKSIEIVAPVHYKQVLTYLKIVRNETGVTD